ncbi:MAG TPA: hypothetical protein VF682_19825 [Pseudomonas sp.]
MEQNLALVSARLAHYTREPDNQFRTSSGFTAVGETAAQKLRHYWDDKSIPNEVKLLGFEMDLSDFDPRNTTFTELRKIRIGLQELGIIDFTTGGVLDGIDLEFDAQGNQVNKDKKVDVFEFFERELKNLKKYIADGHSFANDTLIKLNTGIQVMRALDERSKFLRSTGLIDTQV